MAGVTRLELATSCVTGRRSNRLSYTPDKGRRNLPEDCCRSSELGKKMIRTTDVKEVGVGNTAEETCRCPNQLEMVCLWPGYVNPQILTRPNSSSQAPFRLNSFVNREIKWRRGRDSNTPAIHLDNTQLRQQIPCFSMIH